MSKKRFGQHFITDPGILKRIIEFSRVGPGDVIVEIGPGRGALTTRLAKAGRSVTAIEIDSDLIESLRQTVQENVEVIEEDALNIDYATLLPQPFVLVANLPYNVATPLIERFIAARTSIRAVTTMVQKEVADRILAAPGGREYGPLSIGVQYYADVEGGFVLPPGAFRPPPKVHSRMIRLEWKPDIADKPEFIRFVRNAFTSRRKKLVNNLSVMFPQTSKNALTHLLEQEGLSDKVRPEELSVEQFLSLFSRLDASR